MNLKLYPAVGYILIEILEVEQKTSQGLYMPDSTKEEPMFGKVLVTGRQKMNQAGKYDEANFVIGDTVLFKPMTQYELSNLDNKLAFVSYDSILGVKK